MRVHGAISAIVWVACVSVAACDGSSLEPLRADLVLTPANVNVTSWIGYESRASFTATNTGRVALDIEAPLLAPVEGLDILEGREILDGTTLSLTQGTRIEAGASFVLDVLLRPTVEGTSTLVLVVTPEDGEVAPASASIALDARTPPPCVANGPCETAVFDEELGLCVHTALAEGTACSDGSLCTTNDRCSQGSCVGEALTCEDSVGCTVDACDPSVGCVFTPVNERCADDNPCTTDVCAPSSGGTGCRNDTSPDGTLCGPFSCAELSTCFFGTCVSAPTPDGFPCEDGDLCTTGDMCASQACVPGDAVDPIAHEPVALTMPTAHVEYDVRWFIYEIDDIEAPPIDVPLSFGAVLDVAQGLVGARPTLAVLWRSQPFDFDGAPCSPWDMWRTPVFDGPSFCASAVVVTFIDEAELAAGEGGTSLVLDVIYGTAGASFANRGAGFTGVTDDELRVVVVESTYLPSAASGREVHITRAALSFAARDVVTRADEVHVNAPHWGLERNVHSGIRVAIDDAEPAHEIIVGWDLPVSPELAIADDDASDPDSEPDATHAAIDVPQWSASLDVAAIDAPDMVNTYGTTTWTPLLNDTCAWEPAPSESNAWLDVDVARSGGRSWVLARHRDLALIDDGCESSAGDAMELTALEIDDDDGPLVTWGFGYDVRSASLTARGTVLARLHEPSALLNVDVDCPAEEGGCPPYTLDILPQPFDPNPDPVVQLEVLPVYAVGAVPVRVAALDDDAGVLGALLVERDPITGLMRARLLDAVDANTVGIELTSSFFDARDVSGPQRVQALRSPLSPQRVYAVMPKTNTTTGADDGVVVRFGCPFPTLP